MNIKVFDFFSGCGGTSLGLKNAGLDISFALDFNLDAATTFKTNFPEATVVNADIKTVIPEQLYSLIKKFDDPILFCGCAPCQPFSQQKQAITEDDPRKNLLSEFGKFVSFWTPDFVLVENVPGIQKMNSSPVFSSFLSLLEKKGYQHSTKILTAGSFGVPQNRRRLVLLAALNSDPGLPEPTYGPKTDRPFSTVKEWISDLPALAAGEQDSHDVDHQAASLSPLNILRIKSTLEGGGRENWDESLWLNCHKSHKGHSDVYGRLSWNRVASAMTTRCVSYSNGRFGHPDQDRAISLREAACLQTFPRDFQFFGKFHSKARQVGNAVPPLMAKAIGEHIQKQICAKKFQSHKRRKLKGRIKKLGTLEIKP